MPKPLIVWITINCGKFWKRWEYQRTCPDSWETYPHPPASTCIWASSLCAWFVAVILHPSCSLFRITWGVLKNDSVQALSSVQSLTCVRLFATPWITARQASLSITNSWSLLKHMSIESVMPSSHLILCRPLLLLPLIPPSIRSFPVSQLFSWGGQSTGVSALASVLPKNTQDWFPLEWTGWISLQSKGLSTVFSNTTVQKHQYFAAQLSSQSNSHIHTWPQENHSLD